jgi:hypothetical protein
LPETVAKVREATAQQGTPKAPKVTRLAIETVPQDQASTAQGQHVAKLRGLSPDAVPPVHLTWCHLSLGPSGALVGSCPQMPSDLEATIGVYVEPRTPPSKKRSWAISTSQPLI